MEIILNIVVVPKEWLYEFGFGNYERRSDVLQIWLHVTQSSYLKQNDKGG